MRNGAHATFRLKSCDESIFKKKIRGSNMATTSRRCRIAEFDGNEAE